MKFCHNFKLLVIYCEGTDQFLSDLFQKHIVGVSHDAAHTLGQVVFETAFASEKPQINTSVQQFLR